jgi:hypothetical protein
MQRPRISIFALLFSLLMLAGPQRARAYTLFQVIPIFQLNEIADDNVGLTSTHAQADLVTNILAGIYADYRGPARDGSFEYETIGEVFAKESKDDNFGGTQFFQMSDHEHLSQRTTLSMNDWFLTGKIPSSLLTSGSVSNASPTLNSQLALAILATIPSVSNLFTADLRHDFTEKWSDDLHVRQEFFQTANTMSLLSTAGGHTDYFVLPRVAVGVGYDFYDFRFKDSPSPVDTQFPQFRLQWDITRQLEFDGLGGLLISSRPSGGSPEMRPGYDGSITYLSPHWRARVGGGQTPGITASGGAGRIRDASGDLAYLIDRRTTLFAGISYYEMLGGQNPQNVFSYGGGASYRINRWLVVYAQYVGLRESAPTQSGTTGPVSTLPSSSRPIKSNIMMIGMSLSFEAFRDAL